MHLYQGKSHRGGDGDSAGEFSTAYGGEWASADDFASGKVAWGVGGKGEGSQGGTDQDAKLGWWKQDKDDKACFK